MKPVLLNPGSRLGAFTLIELLVVISIIAILSTILLPVIGMVRDRANIAVCLSNAKQLTLSVFLFANDNEGSVAVRDNGHFAQFGSWTRVVQAAGMIEDRRVYACPTSRFASGTSYVKHLMSGVGAADTSQWYWADGDAVGWCNYGAHVGLPHDGTGGFNTDPVGPSGTTATWQGSITHLAQATSQDCLLEEYCRVVPDFNGPSLTHWDTQSGRPRNLTVTWFDGAATRCAANEVTGFADIYTIASGCTR